MAEPNWKNQTIWTGDCLAIMRGMNAESVDLIYLDPPFNSNANYAAPIGSKAAGAAFTDTWGLDDINLAWHGEIKADYPGLYALLQATRTIHGDSMMSYLIYMAIRIMEMRRVLKKEGSLYLHCDPTASHYLKLLMDSIFGEENFRNEVMWKRQSAHNDGKQGRQQYGRIHDTLLFYTKSKAWGWNPTYMPYDDAYIAHRFRNVEPETGRRYNLGDLTGPGGATKGNPQYEVLGVTDIGDIHRKGCNNLLKLGVSCRQPPDMSPCISAILMKCGAYLCRTCGLIYPLSILRRKNVKVIPPKNPSNSWNALSP